MVIDKNTELIPNPVKNAIFLCIYFPEKNNKIPYFCLCSPVFTKGDSALKHFEPIIPCVLADNSPVPN